MLQILQAKQVLKELDVMQNSIYLCKNYTRGCMSESKCKSLEIEKVVSDGRLTADKNAQEKK